jgi:hypothetical protein
MNYKYLLLGSGYTLKRLSRKFNAEEILLIQRSKFEDISYRYISCDVSNTKDIKEIFQKYKSIEYIVDSIPPNLDSPTICVENVINNLPKKIKGIIYLSTTGVYGCQSGDEVNELSETNPVTVSGMNRKKCEQLYGSVSIPTCCLRLSAICSETRGTLIALSRNRYPYVPNRWSNRIHVSDIVQIILKLLTQITPEIWPKISCVSDNEPTLTNDVVNFYCTKFKLPFPKPLTETEILAIPTMQSNQRVSNKLLNQILAPDKLLFPNYRSYSLD